MRQVRVEPPLTRPEPRDPSPSIWAYRMHRLWLTPIYRRLLRLGVPALAGMLVVIWYVSDEARVTALTDRVAELQRAVEERPEFMVEVLAVDGAGTELAQAVRDTMSVGLPLSSFDLELDVLKERAESLDAVARARLRIKPGGVLQVDIEERVPAVLWREAEALTLLDAEGHRVAAAATRSHWPDLPVIAGVGADAAVPEALALIDAAGPLMSRLRGLERRGERRWDIVLDRRQRVMLPEEGAVSALERLIALHEARDMLERDIAIVDLRNPHRPTLRLNRHAESELRRIRSLEAEGASQ